MNEEIKRILNEFNSHIEYDESMCCLSIKEVKALLDYITNLQQKDFESQKEIMKLKDKLEQQRKEYQDTYKDVRIEIKEKNERIANLQQDLDKANDIIEKDRQFYKCRMDEYVKLNYANEILRKNAEHNDKVVDKARWNEMIYKSRCMKAIKFNQIVLNSDYVYSQDEIAFKNLNILNGSDE